MVNCRRFWGWFIVGSYGVSIVSQVICVILSFRYCFNHLSDVCPEYGPKPDPYARLQHLACMDCYKPQGYGHRNDLHRSVFHFLQRHASPRSLLFPPKGLDRHSREIKEMSVKDSELDSRETRNTTDLHSGKDLHSRQVTEIDRKLDALNNDGRFMILTDGDEKRAYKCHVFVCSFNQSIDTVKNDSENSDKRLGSNNDDRSEANLDTFNLHTGDKKCRAYGNHRLDDEKDKCHPYDVVQFTFQLTPSLILSIGCQSKMLNGTGTVGKGKGDGNGKTDIADDCHHVDGNDKAMFNSTEIRLLHRQRKGNSSAFRTRERRSNGESPEQQRNEWEVLPWIEIEDSTKLMNISDDEGNGVSPNNRSATKSMQLERSDVTGSDDQSSDSVNDDVDTLLMVASRIMGSTSRDASRITASGGADEDDVDEDNDGDKWIDLDDGDNASYDARMKHCKKQFFYPHIAVYIQIVTIIFTVICAVYGFRHVFYGYYPYSVAVAATLAGFVCGGFSVIVWPDVALDKLKHMWFFWLGVACLIHLVVAVLFVIFFLLIVHGDRDNNSDGNARSIRLPQYYIARYRSLEREQDLNVPEQGRGQNGGNHQLSTAGNQEPVSILVQPTPPDSPIQHPKDKEARANTGTDINAPKLENSHSNSNKSITPKGESSGSSTGNPSTEEESTSASSTATDADADADATVLYSLEPGVISYVEARKEKTTLLSTGDASVTTTTYGTTSLVGTGTGADTGTITGNTGIADTGTVGNGTAVKGTTDTGTTSPDTPAATTRDAGNFSPGENFQSSGSSPINLMYFSDKSLASTSSDGNAYVSGEEGNVGGVA